MTPDGGRPRPPRCSPADGGGDVRGSEDTEVRFKLAIIELTLPPPPPRGGRPPRGARIRVVVSDEVARESDVRFELSGASSFWATTGEELRTEAASGDEEFDGERTRGLPARPAFGRGEPLLRRFGVGIPGEAFTGAGATAGAGTGDSGSDSGGGELKAGLGGSSSSSGGGDLKAGRAGISGFTTGATGTGTGAAICGGSGTGAGFTGSGGGGGTLRGCVTGGAEVGAGSETEGGGGGGGTGGGTFPCALWLASQSLASVPAESLVLLIRISTGAVRFRRGTLRSVSAFFLAIVGGRTSA